MKAMMRTALSLAACLMVAGSIAGAPARSATHEPIPEKPPVGKPAPDFKLTDWKGKEVSLSQFRKKIVVLEWFSDECPFVKKHYNSGNMQSLQKEAATKGVVWLTICSSAQGKPGFHTGEGQQQVMRNWNASPSDFLIDAEGKVGRMYGSKNTPTMYVIGKDGVLIYEGAIDDTPDADPGSVKTAKNYVRAAILEALSNKAVTTSVTKAYG